MLALLSTFFAVLALLVVVFIIQRTESASFSWPHRWSGLEPIQKWRWARCCAQELVGPDVSCYWNSNCCCWLSLLLCFLTSLSFSTTCWESVNNWSCCYHCFTEQDSGREKAKWASFEIYYPKKLLTNDIAWIDTPKLSYTSVVHLNHLKWSQHNIQFTSLRGHFRRPLVITSFTQSVYYQLWWAITDDIYS